MGGHGRTTRSETLPPCAKLSAGFAPYYTAVVKENRGGGSVLIWVFAFILAGAGIWFWHIQRRIEAGWFRTEAALNNVTEAESRLSLFLAQIFVVNIPIEIQGDRFLPNRIKVGRWNTELPRARPDLWRQNKINSSFLQIFWLWRQRILSRNLMLSDRYFLYP